MVKTKPTLRSEKPAGWRIRGRHKSVSQSTSDQPVGEQTGRPDKISGTVIPERSAMADICDANTEMVQHATTSSSAASVSRKMTAANPDPGARVVHRRADLPPLTYSECLRVVWQQKRGWRRDDVQVKLDTDGEKAAKSQKEKVHFCDEGQTATAEPVATIREKRKTGTTACAANVSLKSNSKIRGKEKEKDDTVPCALSEITIPVLESFEQMICRSTAEGQLVKLSSRTVDLMNKITKQAMLKKNKKLSQI